MLIKVVYFKSGIKFYFIAIQFFQPSGFHKVPGEVFFVHGPAVGKGKRGVA